MQTYRQIRQVRVIVRERPLAGVTAPPRHHDDVLDSLQGKAYFRHGNLSLTKNTLRTPTARLRISLPSMLHQYTQPSRFLPLMKGPSPRAGPALI